MAVQPAASRVATRGPWARGPFEVRRAGSSPVLLRDAKTVPDGDTANVVVMGNLDAALRLRVVDEETARPGGGDGAAAPAARLASQRKRRATGLITSKASKIRRSIEGRSRRSISHSPGSSQHHARSE